MTFVVFQFFFVGDMAAPLWDDDVALSEQAARDYEAWRESRQQDQEAENNDQEAENEPDASND